MRSRLLIISAFCIWSTFGPAVRWLDLPAPAIVFYASLFALMFQGAGLAYMKTRGALPPSGDLGQMALLALCGLVNVVTFFYALKVTTIAAALLTHYTAPVFVAALAPLMLKDRIGRTTAAALAVSAAGLALVFAKGLGGGGPESFSGAVAGTVSGVAYAFVIIFCRRLSGRRHPLEMSFMQCLTAVLVLGTYFALSGLPGITLAQGAAFAAIGLLHTTLANLMYIRGIRDVTAQEAGVLGYFEPVFGILFAFMLLGETPHPLAVAGGGLIIAAGAAVIYQGGGPETAGGAG